MLWRSHSRVHRGRYFGLSGLLGAPLPLAGGGPRAGGGGGGPPAPNAAPLRHRIHQPDRDGAKSSLTLSIFPGEDQIATPSSQWTSAACSSPVSRRTHRKSLSHSLI